ncbi:hypothetical protein CRP227_gp39 [Roseobacter phage CRP-227]|uniref:Peptidase S74 domain-containing protein n=1 Tax=Roseobacter phage CRP-227 TaxID=3072847 RepID=A0AAX3ZXT5_9CAUD|nr:hypothetical protein CRP227_gp39 [Roseobacter phage CRP-227]
MSSIVNYVADGSTTEFQIPFTYISEAHVVVTIDGTATSAFTFLNSSTLQMNTAPTAGAKVQLQRVTPTGALVDFTDGSTLFETDLDLAHQQNRLIAEESKDIATVAKTTIDNNIADVNTVAGIAADVSNVSSRGADVTSVADNMAEVLLADTNAATATTKAAEAVVSANTASAQAAISTTKAGESSASAAASLASQNAAQQARTDTDASEVLALAYKNSAQTSASTATTKASEASQSATTASSQAAVATAKSTEASADAGIALAQAAVATTKAAEASTSESNALSYKDTALAASAASETARAASVVAKDASQVAKTASEAARDAAAASQTAAATSETNAATSAATANAQAGTATTKAGEAATSATAAASSASSAQASKDAALAALDSFDDRYLGQKAADPTVDNDGDALVSGALYFNTTDDIMKVYDGSLWVAAYASLSGAMFGANNLSDVASISASRTTLGLGTGDTPTLAGINTTGNATFGDNDKAIFGAGSDLQIFHDGTASYIQDAGTGDLRLRGSNIVLESNQSHDIFRGIEGGAATIYHNNSAKLATTSTGIDVTGTVTADGLTVDATESYINGRLRLESGANSQDLRFSDTSTTDQNQQLRLSSGNLLVQSQNNAFNAATTRAAFANNGDISFFEDTGTTPKFFWDASAESLGIGTSSPTNQLHVASTANSSIRISAGASGDNDAKLVLDGNGSGVCTIDADKHLTFTYSGTERMRIDSSGNVGIGTSSPAISSKLNVESTTTALDSGGTVFASVTDAIAANIGGQVMMGGYYTGTTTCAFGGFAAKKENATDGNYAGYLQFMTSSHPAGNTEKMRIDSSGNLLVGTTDKNIRDSSTAEGMVYRNGDSLDINRSAAPPLIVNRVGNSDGDIVLFRKDGTTVGSIGTASSYIYIANGDTGIAPVGGTDRLLPVNGSGAIRDAAIDMGYSSGRFKDGYFSGTVNAANFNTTSDATLKTNVETLSGSLDAVKSLRGVSFDWLENGGSEIGVIAQEVEAVLPDVVSTNDQGIKSVKYGNMVALLIEAMKEQQLRIEALEAKLGE